MADEYTPTTEEARRYYVEGRLSAHDGFEPASSAQFERWKDAFVESIRKRIAQKIDEQAVPIRDEWLTADEKVWNRAIDRAVAVVREETL